MVSLIVAMSENRVIGRDNLIPWIIPGEQKYFKTVTLGNTVIMGRKTFESIGKALPGRRNIVLSREKGYKAAGCEVAQSLKEALSMTKAYEEVFVIGGATLYREALPLADKLYITLIHRAFEGDATFPAFAPHQFREILRTRKESEIPHTFLVLERNR